MTCPLCGEMHPVDRGRMACSRVPDGHIYVHTEHETGPPGALVAFEKGAELTDDASGYVSGDRVQVSDDGPKGVVVTGEVWLTRSGTRVIEVDFGAAGHRWPMLDLISEAL